jgi:galactonate dehydratase
VRITDLQLHQIKPRWCFLKVSTDEGLTGWGEPIVEGRAVLEHKPFLVGQDPLRIEYLWQSMYRNTFYHGRVFSPLS